MQEGLIAAVWERYEKEKHGGHEVTLADCRHLSLHDIKRRRTALYPGRAVKNITDSDTRCGPWMSSMPDQWFETA